MGLLLIIAGLLVWLLLGAMLIGVVLIILGVVLFFVPAAPYGYSRWHRGPP